MMRASSSARPRDFGGAFTPRWAPREETLSLTRGGSSPHATGYLGSMQVWGGGPALGQRLADRQGAHHRGENRVSSHTNLHTNLLISVRTCARGTRTRSRQRGLCRGGPHQLPGNVGSAWGCTQGVRGVCSPSSRSSRASSGASVGSPPAAVLSFSMNSVSCSHFSWSIQTIPAEY